MKKIFIFSKKMVIGFIDRFISDSVKLSILLNNGTSKKKIVDHLIAEKLNFALIDRLYSGNYNFSNDEAVILINYLDFFSNHSKLDELLLLIKLCENQEGLRRTFSDSINKKYESLEMKYNNIKILNVVNHGFLNLFRWIINNDKNFLNSVKDDSLIIASRNGDLDFVVYLISNSASVTYNRCKALSEASKYGHTNVVKYLLDNGAIVN